MKIGIVGRGFVGSAVEFGFSPNVGCDAEVRVYDKDPNKSIHSLYETVAADVPIFPTVFCFPVAKLFILTACSNILSPNSDVFCRIISIRCS